MLDAFAECKGLPCSTSRCVSPKRSTQAPKSPFFSSLLTAEGAQRSRLEAEIGTGREESLPELLISSYITQKLLECPQNTLHPKDSLQDYRDSVGNSAFSVKSSTKWG